MTSQRQALVALLVFIFYSGANAKSSKPLIVHCKGAYNTTEDYFYRRTSPFNSTNSTCMHYAWSTNGSFINNFELNISDDIMNRTTGYPTLLVAHSNSTDVCTKSACDLSGIPSLNASTTPFFTVVVFRRIIEFNVTAYPKNKTGNAVKYNCTGSNCAQNKFEDMLYKEGCFKDNETKSYESFFLNSKSVNWTIIESPRSSDISFIGGDIKRNDTEFINIVTHSPSVTGLNRLGHFPKTAFTENSTTFDLTLKHFNYSLSNTSSRLALELIVIHSSSSTNKVQQKFTMDDEYTPSVFSTVTYPVNATDGGNGGYFQWKPISYQSGGRKSTSSQQINRVYSENNIECIFQSDPIVRSWFMVIGTEGDDSYLNTNYSTWTAVLGYGTAPQDRVSFTVIITIIVGLGVPAVLVLLGGVYVVIKKKPWENVKRWMGGSRQGYSRL